MVPGGPAASPACRNLRHETRATFLPAVGEAADPPIVPAIIMRLARTLEDHTWIARRPRTPSQ